MKLNEMFRYFVVKMIRWFVADDDIFLGLCDLQQGLVLDNILHKLYFDQLTARKDDTSNIFQYLYMQFINIWMSF